VGPGASEAGGGHQAQVHTIGDPIISATEIVERIQFWYFVINFPLLHLNQRLTIKAGGFMLLMSICSSY